MSIYVLHDEDNEEEVDVGGKAADAEATARPSPHLTVKNGDDCSCFVIDYKCILNCVSNDV